MRTLPAWILAFVVIASCTNKKATSKPETTEKDSSQKLKQESSYNPYSALDVSPMDMCYFPREYPKLKMSKEMEIPPLARIVYSRPHLQGRHLFEDLLKYEEHWRLGANEATELDLYMDAKIQDKKIKAGRYILYAIPHPGTWTIVLNSNNDTWGLQQDTTLDVARFDIPVSTVNRRLEYFTMAFENTEGGTNLLMAWDKYEARLPILF